MRVREPVKLPDGQTRRGRFDGLTRFFHWSTVALVLFQFASGWSLSLVASSPFFPMLLLLHRSSGSAVWGLTVLRWLWRASFAIFPPFPDSLPAIMRWAATMSERALYLLLFLEPLAGAATTLLRGASFDLFLWSVPPLLPRDLGLSLTFLQLHSWVAFALAGLVGVHALAALFHHIVLKDDVLASMLSGEAR